MVNILKEYGIKSVPLLWYDLLPKTVDEMVQKSIGRSILNPKINREGIVCRSTVNPGISFKVINPEFLLKFKE
jgi:hypothetical protein